MSFALSGNLIPSILFSKERHRNVIFPEYAILRFVMILFSESVRNAKLAEVREDLEKSGIENPSLQIINVNSKESQDLKAILSVRTKFIAEGSSDLENITGIVNIKLSVLSKNPPCPGSEFPESFTPASRFKRDSHKSPI